MGKTNTISMRTSPEFKKMIEKVTIERLKMGKDTKPLRASRVTLALSRIPDLEKVLIDSEYK